MARFGSGVEIRAKSIRFPTGKPTLRIDGKIVKPTPPNVAWAYRLAADVRDQMERGTFSIAQFLAGLHGDWLTVEAQLHTLLGVLRMEEAEAIIADMLKQYPAQVANYAEFKFFTGLRSGELFGLRWASVDLPNKRMVMSESIVGKVETKTTKTKQIRTVILNSRAYDALRDQKQYTFMAGQHVFHDPRDGKLGHTGLLVLEG